MRPVKVRLKWALLVGGAAVGAGFMLKEVQVFLSDALIVMVLAIYRSAIFAASRIPAITAKTAMRNARVAEKSA